MMPTLSPAPPAALHLVPPPPPEDGELREVKVKLPVEQILRLHYARMKKRENFSQIVSSALTRYFDDLASP
ncbi:MAG TPA: hypothetical protein VM241_07465 [Candidatus Thermoplasmatota archaeon]|nr:hypothetical protein [Candidatus Thermoplasmatota archaeon]